MGIMMFPADSDFAGVVENIRENYGTPNEVIRVDWPNGTYSGVAYVEDEYGLYAIIGYNLPAEILAEIDGGTFGTLQGFRVFIRENE